MTTREKIAALDSEILLLDGFDDALIGVGERCGQPPVAVYNKSKCIDALVSRGMGYGEAIEYLEFNILGAWVGDRTPIIVDGMPSDPT